MFGRGRVPNAGIVLAPRADWTRRAAADDDVCFNVARDDRAHSDDSAACDGDAVGDTGPSSKPYVVCDSYAEACGPLVGNG